MRPPSCTGEPSSEKATARRNTPPGKNGEVQLTDALQAQAREGRVLAYQFEGLRFDCGSVPGFVEATQYVFEHYYGQPA